MPARHPATLYTEATEGSRRSLGRLLSLVERGGSVANEVSDLSFRDAGSARVIGITGAPGAGKSTITGALVGHLVGQGLRPGVLAVDPSSPLTGGAILGDRIRMDDRASTPDVPRDALPFIRSMATRGHSGGLALAVPAALRLFDIAGYDPVIVETVGIGQVEVDVAAVTDTTVVVVQPGMGDSVQANKSGLLEVADVFVVNKADRPGADQARRDLDLMLDLGHVTGHEDPTGWRPPILMTTATSESTAENHMDELWETVESHRRHLLATDQLHEQRLIRLRAEVRNRVEQQLTAAGRAAVEELAPADLLGAAPTTLASRICDDLRSNN